MFTPGFEKAANTAADRSKIRAIGNAGKKVGKHLHKYRRDYIMAAGAGGAIAGAAGSHKKTAEEVLKGGKADGVPDKCFNKAELKKGEKHESEHTKNKQIQKEIAKDHLVEDKKYYDKLNKIEKKAFSTGFEKEAKVLTTKSRDKISDNNFALPGRRYPIHDESHARNALARVAQNGTPDEQAKVKSAVHRKYPEIGEN